MAITWPSPTRAPIAESEPVFPVRVAMIPGSQESWETRTRSWRPRADHADLVVPLFGIGGRLVGVTRTTQHPAAAWEVVGLVCRRELTDAIAVNSAAILPIRSSQLASLARWLSPGLQPDVVPDLAGVIQRTQNSATTLSIPPVPGIERYLMALDDQVRAAVRGERSPHAALEDVAQQWRAITAQLGGPAQAEAYQRSLGIQF